MQFIFKTPDYTEVFTATTLQDFRQIVGELIVELEASEYDDTSWRVKGATPESTAQADKWMSNSTFL